MVGLQPFFWLHQETTLHDLLSENSDLREALDRPTWDNQIGCSKVVSQERVNGKVLIDLSFVETAPGDKLNRILEKQYLNEGDIVYFDALIIKFTDPLVRSGEEKALYLWGESMARILPRVTVSP